MNSLPLLCITGPTAIGKTGLAIKLAEQYPIEIISVDSALVYRQLSIGANKPSEAELAACRHHLVDIADVQDGYNVQSFINDVEHAIADIQTRGKIPVLVGGTMMYFYQLINGLANIPHVSPETITIIEKRKNQTGLSELYKELLDVDPLWASKVNVNDPQRIIRGLAVYWTTGKPLSSYFQNEKDITPRSIKMLALVAENKQDHRNVIMSRLSAMIDQGFIEEVERLWSLYPNLNLDFWRFVGYRQLLSIFTEQAKPSLAIEQAYYATVHLAKRQKTWLNKFEAFLCPVSFENNKAVSEVFEQHINEYFLKSRF